MDFVIIMIRFSRVKINNHALYWFLSSADDSTQEPFNESCKRRPYITPWYTRQWRCELLTQKCSSQLLYNKNVIFINHPIISPLGLLFYRAALLVLHSACTVSPNQIHHKIEHFLWLHGVAAQYTQKFIVVMTAGRKSRGRETAKGQSWNKVRAAVVRMQPL